jgi:D-inositol-3-phosphate glycosyltransferase
VTKILYISELPVNRELQKDTNGDVIQIDGGQIAGWSFIENVVRYSHQDQIVFPRQARASCGDFRDTEVMRQNDDRVRFVNSAELLYQGVGRDMLLLSSSWGLDYLLTLRAGFPDRSMPAVSLIHSLCSPSVLSYILNVIQSGVRSYDALVSPSIAGKRTLEQMWQHISRSVEAFGHKTVQEITIPVIPLGVGEEFFSPCLRSSEKSTVDILYLGRMSVTSKGDLVPLLLAWKGASEKHLNARLTLAGDDTQQRLAKSLLEAAASLGCAGSVFVIPNPTTAQKLKLYREADIFVSPSDSLQETFGLTVVEAMATGLPVIASDWSGYRELVQDGATGFLVPTIFPSLVCGKNSNLATPFLSDLPAASTTIDLDVLEHRLCRLIADFALRREMGSRGRARAVALYRWPTIIQQHDELWDELRKRSVAEPASKDFSTFLDVSLVAFFEHYATSTMTDSLEIKRRTQEASQARLKLNLASENYQGANRMKMVFAATRKMNWIQTGNLGSIMLDLGYPAIEPREILRHVGRLAKYGLIEMKHD